MQIDYTAKRSLKAGHTVDTAYVITVGLVADDRISNTVGSQSIALNGNTVSVIHRGDIVLSISSQLVSSSSTPDVDDMREFLDSVKFGETFQLDSVDYVLDSFQGPYSEQRIAPNWHRFSFRARQLP